VWVKQFPKNLLAEGPGHSDSSQITTGAPIEVLVTPAAFGSVVSVFKRAGEEQSLGIRFREQSSAGEPRLQEAQVTRGTQQIGKWRLREVRQISRAAIVIDDLGQNLKAADELVRLDYPISFSVLPRLQYSRETAEEAHRAGREVMLHLPMEPEPGAVTRSSHGVITVGMPEAEVSRIVEADLDAVSYVRGVNNHQGSRATSDPKLMLALMKTLAQHRLFFIDSRTTANTVALDEARRAGVPAFFRSVFLDDNMDTAYTAGQLDKLRRLARQEGAALAIGHPHQSTIDALKQYLPQFERDDIELVPASELVRLPGIRRLKPRGRMAENAVASRE
jgi:polysaccharide deacetylase 2 family uncharacterized protein YibQ